MITCKEATRLASQQLDGKLSLGERLQLRLHLAICEGCRRANAQFALLRRMTGSWMNHKD